VKLKDELLKIVVSLDKAGIDYALCGGLAVAIHGHPRMTKDIDILIRWESLEAAKAALADIEYDLESGLFRFNPNTDHESQMYRVSRAEGNDLVTLDLMLVAPVFESVWNDREIVSLGEMMIKVVSKKGLITMKSVAARPQDIADIAALRRLDDDQ
jgi:hypothetical protein